MEKKRKSNSKGKGKEKRDWAARLLVDTIPELLPALLLAETLQRETERVSYEQLVVLLGRSDVDDHHAHKVARNNVVELRTPELFKLDATLHGGVRLVCRLKIKTN